MTPITPEHIEGLAKASGLSMNRVCRDAGVTRSIFTRWKNRSASPSVENVNRLIAAINAAKDASGTD